MTADETSRLARLEVRVDKIHTDLAEVRTDVREVRDALYKQRGFAAGFSFAFTVIWAALAAAVAWVWRA